MPSAPLPMGRVCDSQSVAGSSYHRVVAGFPAAGTGFPVGGAPWAGVPAGPASPAAAATTTARIRDVLR
jgi:hypothetical protein